MKKARTSKQTATTGDLRPEYRFDYRKARPNRFAGRMPHAAVAVVLDPKVASVFESSASVNNLLRSVIKAMPDRAKKRRKVG